MSDQPRKINWWVPAGVLVAIGIAYVVPVIKLWISGAPPPPAPRQFTTTAALNLHPSFSPDGSVIVFSANGTLRVKTVADSSENILTEGIEPSYSPDGKSIAYRIEGKGIFTISAGRGEAKQVSDRGTSPAWWPDSSKVVFADKGTLWTPTEAITKANEPEGEHAAPRFNPDKKHLGFLSGKRLWEINIETRQLTQVTEGDPWPTGFVYGRDGLTVYFLAAAGKKAQGLYQLTRDPITRKPKAKPVTLSEGEGATLQDLEIDGSGKRLAYSMVTGDAPKQTANIFLADLQ